MVEILLDRLLQRVDDLQAAYTANEDAFAAFKRAEKHQRLNPCAPNNHTMGMAELNWNAARSEIVNRAQHMAGTLALLLACKPYSTHAGLIQHAQYLKDAFHTEAVKFNHYSRITDGSQESWQAWQDARGEIISRARPLIDLVKNLPAAVFESSTPTEVGS